MPRPAYRRGPDGCWSRWIAFNSLSLRVKIIRWSKASWSGNTRCREAWPSPRPRARF